MEAFLWLDADQAVKAFRQGWCSFSKSHRLDGHEWALDEASTAEAARAGSHAPPLQCAWSGAV
ncbi:MAG: hypothetical protein MUC96_17760 [Myxococcaceae bacterium]|jgi:hypothetical protein|nr:hypothetical protein [Myxococcaceae bacterium]